MLFGVYEFVSVGAVPDTPEPHVYVTVNGTTHCDADVDPAGDVVPDGHSVHHGLPASLNCCRVLAYVPAGHGLSNCVLLNIIVA